MFLVLKEGLNKNSSTRHLSKIFVEGGLKRGSFSIRGVRNLRHTLNLYLYRAPMWTWWSFNWDKLQIILTAGWGKEAVVKSILPFGHLNDWAKQGA